MAQSRLISAQYAFAARGGFGSSIVVAGAFGVGVGVCVLVTVNVVPSAVMLAEYPAGTPSSLIVYSIRLPSASYASRFAKAADVRFSMTT